MVLRQGGEPPSPQVIYTFMEAQKANHRISRICRVLKVSKSGFYGWQDRAPSARAQADALLSEKIYRIHTDSRQTYGAPRVHFELRMVGVRCGRKRVARLMREAGLFGCGGRRRKARTTLRSQTESIPPAPDLVKRNFTPASLAPDCLWVADITYVRTWEGCLYLSFVLDTYSRKVVGWSMANNLRTGLVLDALNMAIYTRRPQPGLIHHSDRGSQYTSVEFGSRLKEAGLLPSMGSVADAYDNSMAESFVSTLKRELIHRHSWPNRQMARTAIFEYIEGFYNTRRRHSALGNLSPSEYERVRLKGGAVA
jgi:putative transposase